MKFKRTDEVRIRKDLCLGHDYGGIIINERLLSTAGMICLVKYNTSVSCYGCQYILHRWDDLVFSEEMIEPVTSTDDDYHDYDDNMLKHFRDIRAREEERKRKEKENEKHNKILRYEEQIKSLTDENQLLKKQLSEACNELDRIKTGGYSTRSHSQNNHISREDRELQKEIERIPRRSHAEMLRYEKIHNPYGW